jgi:hypothetical protein
MKIKLLAQNSALALALLLSAYSAHATDVRENEEVATTSSRFHLLKSKCEPQTDEEIQSSPQSPPLIVDDPGTPGCNKWEINVLVDADLTLTDKSWELPLLDINYGIGDNFQLKYEVPNVNVTSDGTTNAGIASSKVGLKYLFFEDEASKFALAVYPQVEFTTPSSDAERKGLATAGNITTLPILLSKKLGESGKGDIMLTANAGYNISTKAETKNFVSVAAGVGMPLIARIAIMGEISTEQSIEKNADGLREQLVKANLGLMSPIYKRVLIYGSVGQSLYSSDDKVHNYVLAGLRL